MSDKKYNLNVVPLWETANGNFKSIKIKREHFDAIQQIEEGGMLLVKILPDTARKSEDSPNAMLEYVSPADLAAYKNRMSATTSENRTLPRSYDVI